MSSTYLLILLSLLCYTLFFIATWTAWKKGSEKILVHGGRIPDISVVRDLQIKGVMVLGVPVIIGTPGPMEWLSFPRNNNSFWVPAMCILIVIVFTISWLAATQKIKQPTTFRYPSNTNLGSVINYFLFRILFLITYEFFFRGVLLFDIASVTGIAISITINIVLYVLIHFFDDRHTIMGAIPFGIVMIWLSWRTQSAWPAIILHLVLALTYEIKMLCHLFQSPKKIIS